MSVRDSYYPVCITFLVVDGVAIGLRFWARGMKKAVGYDDVTMAISLVGFVIFCAMELVAVDNGIGATVMEPQFNMIEAAKWFTVAQIVYILTTGISKLGVGLVLYRLAAQSDMRVVRLMLMISMIIVGLWSLATALVFGLQCRPLSVAWGVGTGTCLSTSVLGEAGIALSGMDMTISWFYALLPIHMLYKAQLRLKLKITVLVLLGLGAVSSVATIVRLKYVIDVKQMTANGGLASPEIIQTTLEGTLYSVIEIGLSILAASLTALRPLLKKVPCFSDISSGGYSGSKGLPHGSNRSRVNAYRLQDMNATDVESTEEIFGMPREAKM